MSVNATIGQSRLKLVGWLYVAVGTYALIEEVVGWLHPLENPILRLGFWGPSFWFNTTPFLLLIGIGLLLRKEIARKVALVFSTVIIALALVLAVFLAFGEGTWTWTPLVHGDDEVRAIASVVIGVPVFVWQFRALRSREVREAATENP